MINLSIKGTNKKRNDAILNTLIQVLSEDQVADKRAISEVSIAFIEDRLKGLSESIDTISQNTIDYQMDNGIFDPEAQTGNALNNYYQRSARSLCPRHPARNCQSTQRTINRPN